METNKSNIPVSGKFTFFQEQDSCGPLDCNQTLTVEIDDAGGGPYIILKTKRWALSDDEIDAFSKMLKKHLKYFRPMFEDDHE